MIPVGAWVRVSTGLQDEANQVPDVERYCAEHGYTIVKRYELNDMSAYKGDQDARQREALDDTRTGTVKVVVAWASDRVERRGAEATLRIFREFREAGGKLESVQEPFLNTDDSELMTAITGWKDRAESARKSERVRIAFDRIKANGAANGRAPYGFTVAGDAKYNKRFEIVETEAEIIREAAERYLGGETLQTICDDFNRRGIPLPHKPRKPETSRGWTPKSLSQVLTRPAICGRHVWGGETVRVPPIISLRDFNAVGARLASRAHRKGVPSSKDTAMLTSVLKCGICARNVYAVCARNGYYYYCRGGCQNMLKMDYADNRVSAWITSSRSYEIMERTEIKGEHYDDEIDQIRQDIRELDPETEDYDARNRELRAELKHLRSLPSVPDRTELAGTGRFASDEWPSWSKRERRRFLLDNGFTVILRGKNFPKEWRIEVIPGEAYRAKVSGG